MTDPTPPPLPRTPAQPPPPPPPPYSFVQEGLARLRTPAFTVLIGVVLQAVVYLVGVGWMIFLMVVVAQNATNGLGQVVPGLVMLGAGAAFNLLSLAVLFAIAYGAVRMMRADGYGWALGGAITQVVWGTVHGSLMLVTAAGLGFILAPIEVTIAIVVGCVALVVLSDRRVATTFDAVERYPELLSESAAES